MTYVRLFSLTALVFVFACVAGCEQQPANTTGNDAAKTIRIGVIGKSQSNAVFQAAYRGAMDAADKLGPEYGVKVEILWQTPTDEDPQKQAQFIEQLAREGVQGIAVSVSHAQTVTPAIDKAVELGSQIICFDSDAPDSKRLCFYGTDDTDCGTRVMQELGTAMSDEGTIAILAGNQAAPNLQARKDAVIAELKKHPQMSLLDDGVFYHKETPADAASALNTAQNTNTQIKGWALIGGWPLFSKNALRWNPGDIKVVSVDALPAMLNYLESGHVDVLLAQDCYGWGYESVRLLLDKIVNEKNPESQRIIAPLTRVTKDNVEEYAQQWLEWVPGN